MNFCRNCGAYSPEGSNFCAQCGSKIVVENIANDQYLNVNNSQNTEHSETNIRKIDINTKKEKKNKKIKLTKEEKKKRKLEQKELHKADKEVFRTVKEKLNIIDVDDNDRFITKTGVFDIYQINTKDIYAFSETDKNINIFSFISFIRAITNDFKIITMKFPVNTEVQQDFLRKKIEKCNNEIHKSFLIEKLEELEYLEENRFNKEFYLMNFYNRDDEIELQEKKLNATSNVGVNLKKLDLDKKIRILYKLNNMNSKL